MAVFRSVHHPGDKPQALVYGRALGAPLIFCFLPVMISATAVALQQQPIAPFLTWGAPAAFGAAVIWTRYQLSATPAEIHVRDHEAAVRSVHDCLDASRSLHWEWIHEIRVGPDALIVTMGFETYRFPHGVWPNSQSLRDALRSAQSAGPSTSPSQQSPSHHA
jgi:hypothetical protein